MDGTKRWVPVLLILVFALTLASSVTAGLNSGQSGGRLSKNDTLALKMEQGRSHYSRNFLLPLTYPVRRIVTSTITATQQIFLPVILQASLTPPYDMVPFLVGDQRLYEVQHSSGSQARHQTQVEEVAFFHTKGNEVSAEWEELWYTEAYIYRGTDTSPGQGLYYTLRDEGIYGSAWAPRYWHVGDMFERNPLVTFYQKSDCSIFMGGYQQSWLKFTAYYPQYLFDSGIVINNVVELAWLLEPTGEAIEHYFYAYDYGLIGWWSNDRGMSYISEIHAPGDRPDNSREEIPCLDTSPLLVSPPLTNKLPYWPGEHRR